MTSAKIILDSWNGHTRLTTMEVKFHRFILPEFNTHRAFSRNAASSRAIPVAKQIEAVRNDPALPVFWGKNQAGMSAYEELDSSLTDSEYGVSIKDRWILAMEDSVWHAKILSEQGLHKQLASRLIEPFMWTTMIVSFTESDNFFDQRCPPSLEMTPSFPAQPEMQVLAIAMKKALNESDPVQLNRNEWHIPFLTGNEISLDLQVRLKLSAARCARVSYLNHDKSSPDVYKDMELADKLITGKHMSPLEHQARNMGDSKPSANFRGWNQYRGFIERQQLHNLNVD